jgi:hypothetical protein
MLIYANPTTTPRPPKATTKTRPRRAASKGATTMARKTRSAAQKAATRRMLAANKSRKRHRNPAPRKATRSRRSYAAAPRRRSVQRNPSAGLARGILGELASKDGLILLGSAAIAPTTVDFIAEKVVPVQYQSGWTGLLAKAAIAAAATYALDRYGKQRKAAIGFAVGAGGSLVALAYRTFRAGQALPAGIAQASPATADEIAKNPTLYESLMNQQGSSEYASLNGYAAVPMSGYAEVPMGNDWESLN